jgi:hypothetical protein
MKISSLLWFAPLLICATVSAQKYEVSVGANLLRLDSKPLGSVATTGGLDSDTYFKKVSVEGASLRLTWNSKGYFGHEIGYSYNRSMLNVTARTTDADGNDVVTKYQQKVKVAQLTYNFLIYMMPAGERIRPYITMGATVQDYGAPSLDLWPQGQGRSRNYGGNFGAGIKVRLFPHTQMRLDLRQHFVGAPYNLTFADPQNPTAGTMKNATASVGFGVTF